MSRLTTCYAPSEAQWLVRIIFEQIKGFSTTDMVMKADKPCSEFTVSRIDNAVDRLLAHEPVQYIFGVAHFYGLDFKVTPDVLIPRPETEQLVDMIADDLRGKSDVRLLDIGTGSGCIAIALARTLAFSKVTAIDVSTKALAVAEENARNLGVKIAFTCQSIFDVPIPDRPIYDVIASNPPYILPGEASEMSPNVLDNEPHIALFVPTGNDGLVFVKAISGYGLGALVPGGKLYMEINPLLSQEIRRYLESQRWEEVAIIADERRKNRFVTAVRPT